MTALLTAVSCCVSHWAVGVMVNLGLWFFLMFGAYQVSFALGQPAYVTELSVDDQGNVTAVAPGRTTVTATVGDQTFNCAVRCIW